mmetsp:Transcript_17578/g.36414  ORF Transcript_17578/g.36414 Transcript_17578/m.36414 type:complete len:240 (+) Transcript_17578:325-1044(+)
MLPRSIWFPFLGTGTGAVTGAGAGFETPLFGGGLGLYPSSLIFFSAGDKKGDSGAGVSTGGGSGLRLEGTGGLRFLVVSTSFSIFISSILTSSTLTSSTFPTSSSSSPFPSLNSLLCSSKSTGRLNPPPPRIGSEVSPLEEPLFAANKLSLPTASFMLLIFGGNLVPPATSSARNSSILSLCPPASLLTVVVPNVLSALRTFPLTLVVPPSPTEISFVIVFSPNLHASQILTGFQPYSS